jgi:hypothetical protein
MRRSRISAILPSLLALLAAGCDSDPVEPRQVAAEFVLQSVNGAPLPAEKFDNGTFSFILLSETLRLEEDGSGTQESVHRTDFADPAKPDQRTDSLFPLTYRLRGDRLEVSFHCPPNALCTEGPHLTGRMDGAALVLTDVNGDELRYSRR